MTLQSLIDKPKELLEFINDCLKPKDIEKKKYGEVFTPMPLIYEMIDKKSPEYESLYQDIIKVGEYVKE